MWCRRYQSSKQFVLAILCSLFLIDTKPLPLAPSQCISINSHRTTRHNSRCITYRAHLFLSPSLFLTVTHTVRRPYMWTCNMNYYDGMRNSNIFNAQKGGAQTNEKLPTNEKPTLTLAHRREIWKIHETKQNNNITLHGKRSKKNCSIRIEKGFSKWIKRFATFVFGVLYQCRVYTVRILYFNIFFLLLLLHLLRTPFTQSFHLWLLLLRLVLANRM